MRLAESAMQLASEILARQAEALAEEMVRGELTDRGGPDALRLLAALIRKARLHGAEVAGHA